ncbi:leucine-rich repeat and death domain-containing protein 1-like [Mya arenaria]|uniref:leucine-rich repeat and death domain-containing protein 1-like n=1 Tax=Mya arenaria TaxID=6604 RepID=UPI0022E55817|nr:leucine-rich repeat and death domain-containing protein 1-like [Mya arenaria]
MINLYNNFIAFVPPNAFAAIQSAHPTSVQIYLDSNLIEHVDPDAFSGIEDTLGYLDLSGNRLTTLPSALVKLTNLDSLFIYDNLFKTFDASIMSHLGQSITDLEFSLDNFTTWPQELQYLQKLKSTYIYGLEHLIPIPPNAFQGLESTLKQLYVDDLYPVPESLFSLRNLEYLSFSWYTGEHRYFEFGNYTKTLPSLTTLYFNRLYLPTLPDVFRYFPTIEHLYVYDAELVDIPENTMPINSNLKVLSLTGNNLTSIPRALSNLHSLRELDLSGNRIFALGSSDLKSMDNLRKLNLGSMLTRIDDTAFMHAPNIEELSYGGPIGIPRAVMTLLNLKHLDLIYINENHPTLCTCQMNYLKGWDVTNITIPYLCPVYQGQPAGYNTEQGRSVQEYILHDLIKC